jgi:hypothetical protein
VPGSAIVVVNNYPDLFAWYIAVPGSVTVLVKTLLV